MSLSFLVPSISSKKCMLDQTVLQNVQRKCVWMTVCYKLLQGNFSTMWCIFFMLIIFFFFTTTKIKSSTIWTDVILSRLQLCYYGNIMLLNPVVSVSTGSQQWSWKHSHFLNRAWLECILIYNACNLQDKCRAGFSRKTNDDRISNPSLLHSSVLHTGGLSCSLRMYLLLPEEEMGTFRLCCIMEKRLLELISWNIDRL